MRTTNHFSCPIADWPPGNDGLEAAAPAWGLNPVALSGGSRNVYWSPFCNSSGAAQGVVVLFCLGRGCDLLLPGARARAWQVSPALTELTCASTHTDTGEHYSVGLSISQGYCCCSCCLCGTHCGTARRRAKNGLTVY